MHLLSLQRNLEGCDYVFLQYSRVKYKGSGLIKQIVRVNKNDDKQFEP